MRATLIAAALLGLGTLEAAAQVGGSYQATCKAVVQRGPILEATCATPTGQARRTVIDLRQCGGGSVGNANGQLVCEGGRGRGPRYDDRPRRADRYDGGGGYEDEYRPRRPRYEEEYRPRRRYDDGFEGGYRY